MSLGRLPTGHWASGGGGSAPPHTRPTTSNEGAHSPSSSLLIHLPWTAEPLKPHRCPRAPLAFDGGGEMVTGSRLSTFHSGVVSLWSGEFTNDTAVWQGFPRMRCGRPGSPRRRSDGHPSRAGRRH